MVICRNCQDISAVYVFCISLYHSIMYKNGGQYFIKITAYMSGHLAFGSTTGRVQNFGVE